jgi:GH25 family lysozyme M1 (1,4-beta-N-acetylmuramidase)
MRSVLEGFGVVAGARHAPVSVVLLALLSACGPQAGGPDLTASTDSALCATGTTLEGLDVSSYQGTVSWPSVRSAGKDFIFIRVAHGLAADTKFPANWTQAKSAGLIRGAYQYLVPSQSVSQQADMMVQAMATLQSDDLPPVVDVEEVGSTSPAQLAAMVQQWVDAVKAGTGRTPIVYSGSYFWDDYVQSTAFNTQPLWIPNYGVTCPRLPAAWSNWAFHQYTSSGGVSGISGNVDLDRFNGTLTQLQALVAASGGQSTVPTTGVVTGAIYEGTDTTARLSGATVTAGGMTVTTGGDGMYVFNLPAGSYTVNASKTGYASASVTRVVTSGATIWGSMGLSAVTTTTTGTLAGTVYVFDAQNPADTSHPVSGALVSTGGQSATTTAAGLFSLTLPAGSYTLQVSKSGYATASLTRVVTAGQVTQAAVGLTTSGAADHKPPDVAITFPVAGAALDFAAITLAGTASDDSGAVPTVSVSLNSGAATAVSVTGGLFSVPVKLRPGPNTIEVTAKDAAGNVGRATLDATFRSGVFGAVVDAETMEGVPSATVTLLAADGSTAGQATGSSYAIDVTRVPGEFVLVASADGFVTHQETIHLADDVRRSLDIKLMRGADGGDPAVRLTNVQDGETVGTDTLSVEGEGIGVELARVRVNDVPAVMGSGSRFTAAVPLAPGTNLVEVVAFATNGARLTAQVEVVRVGGGRSGCASTGSTAAWLMIAALGVLLRRGRSRFVGAR